VISIFNRSNLAFREKSTIFNIYHHPETPLNIQSTVSESIFTNAIIAGDFNCHSPTWGYKELDNNEKTLKDFIYSSNLFLFQNAQSKPTLIQKTSKALHKLDLTLVYLAYF